MTKATLTFKTQALAEAFAIAWSRETLTGHTVSSVQADGSAYVVVYNVTEDRKTFIDTYTAALNR